MEDQSSPCSSETEDELDYYLEEDYDYENDLDSNSSHPSQLEKDIKSFELHCFGEQIKYRTFEKLEAVDIEMTVSLDFMKGSIFSNAWAIDPKQPLTLKLTTDCNTGPYQDKSSLKVKAFQDPKKNTNAIVTQVQNIAQTFCKDWNKKDSTITKFIADMSISGESENNNSAPNDSYKGGFLVQLHAYITHRMKTLNEHCPICDKCYGVSSMVMPTVCSNPLCIFSSQIIGVMCQVTDTLSTQPELLELLISMTTSAAMSPRHKDVLRPYPALVDHKTRAFLFPHDLDGLNLLRKVVDALLYVKFPTVSSESELQIFLNSRHELCYPLLRWIISSNRSYITHLREGKMFHSISTPHQYVLQNSPPAVEANFKELAKTYGSCFAFHGSPFENWHAIIRNGLRIGSGTQYQLHGAAKGSGIYVSPCLQTSLRYTGLGIKNYRCVALCEVIKTPDLEKMSKSRDGSIWLVTEAQNICTRFFFLFDKNITRSEPINSTTEDFVDNIRNVLAENGDGADSNVGSV